MRSQLADVPLPRPLWFQHAKDHTSFKSAGSYIVEINNCDICNYFANNFDFLLLNPPHVPTQT